MRKMKKLHALSLAGLLLLTGSSFATADERDPGYIAPETPAAPAAQEEYNPEKNIWEVPQALGDTMADLVYTPVTPCRMVDTRFGTGSFTGPIAAGTTLNIDTIDTGYVAQGGDPTGCDTIDNPAALAVSITAVNPAANGYITAWAWNAPQPTVSVLNYRAGVNINNTTIIPQDISTGGSEMSLYTYSTADIIVDVVGYFNPPVAAAPTTTIVTNTGVIANGTNGNIGSGTCPTGYALTGGGCYDQTTFGGSAAFQWWGWYPSSGQWRCSADNDYGSDVTVMAYGICLQVP